MRELLSLIAISAVPAALAFVATHARGVRHQSHTPSTRRPVTEVHGRGRVQMSSSQDVPAVERAT